MDFAYKVERPVTPNWSCVEFYERGDLMHWAVDIRIDGDRTWYSVTNDGWLALDVCERRADGVAYVTGQHDNVPSEVARYLPVVTGERKIRIASE